jgi:hypothetical protein
MNEEMRTGKRQVHREQPRVDYQFPRIDQPRIDCQFRLVPVLFDAKAGIGKTQLAAPYFFPPLVTATVADWRRQILNQPGMIDVRDQLAKLHESWETLIQREALIPETPSSNNIEGQIQDEPTPPPSIDAADSLLRWLLSPTNYEALLGDLMEGFQKRLLRSGKQSAERWYKRQLLTSIPSLIWGVCRQLAYPGRRKERL